MRKLYRIKKSKEIESILRKKQSYGNKHYILYVTKNIETNHFRLAVSVSKKLGNAVVRNKQKRQIRSIIQGYEKNISNYNLFIIARPGVLESTHQERSIQLKRLLQKSNVWHQEEK
ncbi:MAG: ribonuclease P protein component [bacterium]